MARRVKEEGEDDVSEKGQKEDSEEVARLQMNNLTIETAGTEEEASEGMAEALRM